MASSHPPESHGIGGIAGGSLNYGTRGGVRTSLKTRKKMRVCLVAGRETTLIRRYRDDVTRCALDVALDAEFQCGGSVLNADEQKTAQFPWGI